jgi:hypothetical protein
MFMKLDSQFESKRPAKQTLVDLIIAKQNQRFLFGWNYCSGTSYFREFVYWTTEIAAAIAFLIKIWDNDWNLGVCALIYLIKHVLFFIDYAYLILKHEYQPIEIITNLNNIQFWVE